VGPVIWRTCRQFSCLWPLPSPPLRNNVVARLGLFLRRYLYSQYASFSFPFLLSAISKHLFVFFLDERKAQDGHARCLAPGTCSADSPVLSPDYEGIRIAFGRHEWRLFPFFSDGIFLKCPPRKNVRHAHSIFPGFHFSSTLFSGDMILLGLMCRPSSKHLVLVVLLFRPRTGRCFDVISFKEVHLAFPTPSQILIAIRDPPLFST